MRVGVRRREQETTQVFGFVRMDVRFYVFFKFHEDIHVLAFSVYLRQDLPVEGLAQLRFVLVSGVAADALGLALHFLVLPDLWILNFFLHEEVGFWFRRTEVCTDFIPCFLRLMEKIFFEFGWFNRNGAFSSLFICLSFFYILIFDFFFIL